jgi:hypothetical protein
LGWGKQFIYIEEDNYIKETISQTINYLINSTIVGANWLVELTITDQLNWLVERLFINQCINYKKVSWLLRRLTSGSRSL